jgi:flagellar biosynthesis/type III secretory pathway protein FliH
MTKLERLKVALDAAEDLEALADSFEDAHYIGVTSGYEAAYKAYQAELKKLKENTND